MKDALAGKRALVTGASSGIGRTTATLFAEHGATVVGLAAHWKDTPEGIDCMKGDVANDADVIAAVERAAGDQGLDILVANAGIGDNTEGWRNGKAESWLRVIDVNLVGTMRCFQAAAANMIVNKRKGRLLATTSVAGLRPFPADPAYCASKAGIVAAVQSAALAFAARDITVNVIAPGHVRDTYQYSVMLETRAKNEGHPVDEQLAAWADLVPLRRLGTTADIAGAFLFLASDAASYITGETLSVDGGLAHAWTSGM